MQHHSTSRLRVVKMSGFDDYGYGYGNGNGNYCMPHPYYKIDGIWCKILSIKGNYAKVIIADMYNAHNCVPGFIAKDGINFAHGSTLREARESLMYKIGDRDTSLYKDWKASDKKSFSDLIKAYRSITGACEMGTRQFVSSKNLKNGKFTVQEAISLTEGQWGHETFKEFFKEV